MADNTELGEFINKGHEAYKRGDMLMWHYYLNKCRECYIKLGVWLDA